MELLYVWIENFRNIKQKGFNFSSRYDIIYDEKSNDLFINDVNGTSAVAIENQALYFTAENNDHLKDFFHHQISNISAIIGKNSSGKSNVIDFILTAISSGNRNRLTSNYLLIFNNDNQPLFFGKTNRNSLNSSTLKCMGVQLKKIDPDEKWESMFYSNVADNKDYIFQNTSVHNFSFANVMALQSNKIKFVSSIAFEDTWRKLNPNNQDDKKIRFIFHPVAFTTLESREEDNDEISGILKRYRKAIYQESTSNYNRFRYGLAINLLCFLIINNNDISALLTEVELVGDEGLAENIASLDPKIVKFLTQADTPTRLGKLSELDFELYRSLLLELNENARYNFGVVDKHINSIIVDFNEDFKQVINEKAEVFNTPSLISHDWSQLSSGMRAYLNLFSQLYYLAGLIKNPAKNLLICIDEGDLYLHPEWQRNFINDFIDFVTKTLDNVKIQVILTSHSPFLISDLPKENVILLDDSATPSRQLHGLSSFGANIHQLFTNQFFLNEGSIGEFAKMKIRNLLEDIPNMTDDNIDLFKAKIEMIGEPILRYRLEEKFKERMTKLSAEAQIEWHRQQIAKLQQR